MVCHSIHVCTELLGSREGLSLIPRLLCMGTRLGRGWEWCQAMSWLEYNQVRIINSYEIIIRSQIWTSNGNRTQHKGIFYSKNNCTLQTTGCLNGDKRRKEDKEREGQREYKNIWQYNWLYTWWYKNWGTDWDIHSGGQTVIPRLRGYVKPSASKSFSADKNIKHKKINNYKMQIHK